MSGAAVQVLPSGWQAGFLAVLPAVRTHAQIQFRQLPAHRREEAVQEAIAAACVNYQLAAARGNLAVIRPGMLADFATRHVRTGRHVGGSQDAAKDVLSPVCQRRRGVRVVSYDVRRHDRSGGDGWRAMAIADRNASVPDTACFRVDFQRWLRTLGRRDRRVIAAFAAGDGTGAVAGRFGLSPARVSQLRRKYEGLWRAFQGDGAGPRAAA